MNKTRGTEINYLDFTTTVGFNENVLRFQVTVNQMQTMDEVQCSQNLFCDFLESANCKVRFLLNFPVILGVLIQIISQ